MMLGRVTRDVEAEERYIERVDGQPQQSDPENFENSEDCASIRSTNQGTARNMLKQKQSMNYIQKPMNTGDNNTNKENQSMVSDKNQYSKYLEEEDLEDDQIMDISQLRQVDRAAQGGNNLDDMDDCLYSLDSDLKSARKLRQIPIILEEAPPVAATADGQNISQNEIN